MLHRLNRTEYANAIRDLLDLDIDVSTLLPADDSARGFDNVAGSLTISPTLLEAYTSAATRIGRTAVGFWTSPAEAVYIAPADTSQTERIDGLPLGTRGGMASSALCSPRTAEISSPCRTLVLGDLFPGKSWSFLIDSEVVAVHDYAGVGLTAANAADSDGSIDVKVPIRAGSRTRSG